MHLFSFFTVSLYKTWGRNQQTHFLHNPHCYSPQTANLSSSCGPDFINIQMKTSNSDVGVWTLKLTELLLHVGRKNGAQHERQMPISWATTRGLQDIYEIMSMWTRSCVLSCWLRQRIWSELGGCQVHSQVHKSSWQILLSTALSTELISWSG